MRILVTGSSGFIGYHLVQKLLSLGHQVTGIDNHSDSYSLSLKRHRNSLIKSKNFCFFKIDINDLHLINDSYDIAINLAALPGVREKSKQKYLHSNTHGFKSFCEFCKRKSVSKIIYASSSSVYSDESLFKFNETDTKLKPKSFYGKTKLSNEIYAKEFSKKENISMVGLRFFSVYGPLGRPDMAYYKFVNCIHKNDLLTLFNNGNMYRDMTYIDDIVDGLLASINFIDNAKKGSNQVFNLGNEKPIKTTYLLSTLEKLLKKTANITHKKSKNESKHTFADLTKSKSILGYNPQIDFESGIKKFTEWYINYESTKKEKN